MRSYQKRPNVGTSRTAFFPFSAPTFAPDLKKAGTTWTHHRGAWFPLLSEKVWHAYHAPGRRSFARRMSRLWEWARAKVSGEVLLEQRAKLGGQSKEYAKSYAHPGGHWTSNMLDRVMRGMNRFSPFSTSVRVEGPREQDHIRGVADLDHGADLNVQRREEQPQL